MATFYDPGADAAEASDALRGLAHATRSMGEHPGDMYTVMGDLLSGVRSLRQVVDQLATAHLDQRFSAFDDSGDHTAGATHALAAADELHQTGTLLDQAEERLDQAMNAAGRIAWHPDKPEAAPSRWVSVVFLQGEDAEPVLDVIDRQGPDAGIAYLSGWDMGEETMNDAMENGYVYNQPPAGMNDKVAEQGEYALTYNPAMTYVGLTRRLTDTPTSDDGLRPGGLGNSVGAGQASLSGGRGISFGSNHPTAGRAGTSSPGREPASGSAAGAGAATTSAGSWFAHPGVTAVKRDRGLGR
ncbi:hypothetical protein ACX31A_08025 [Dermacoccus nishinomiyaensis]